MPSFGEKIIYPWSHTDEKVKFIYLLVSYKCKVQKVKQKVNYKQAHVQVFFQVEDWEELHHMANSLAKVTRLPHMDLQICLAT